MNSIKRRHISITAAVIMLSQALTGFQTQHSISDQIDEIKQTIAVAKLEREQFFVRKTELSAVASKLDKMSESLAALKEQINHIGVKTRDR